MVYRKKRLGNDDIVRNAIQLNFERSEEPSELVKLALQGKLPKNKNKRIEK